MAEEGCGSSGAEILYEAISRVSVHQDDPLLPDGLKEVSGHVVHGESGLGWRCLPKLRLGVASLMEAALWARSSETGDVLFHARPVV